MAEIVRKIGRITRYETKAYVGSAKMIDLDKSADPAEPEGENPPGGDPGSGDRPHG
jgi:hypothetical protein